MPKITKGFRVGHEDYVEAKRKKAMTENAPSVCDVDYELNEANLE